MEGKEVTKQLQSAQAARLQPAGWMYYWDTYQGYFMNHSSTALGIIIQRHIESPVIPNHLFRPLVDPELLL